MYCPKCGKEIPKNSNYCPSCNSEQNLKVKENKKTLLIIISVVAVVIVVACISLTISLTSINNNSNTSEKTTTENITQSATETTTVENDKNTISANINSGVGARNIKCDSNPDFTEEEKIIYQYFDNDYINIYEYDMLARYPTIFEGSQICFTGTVEKIIKSNDKEYEALVWFGKSEANFYYKSATTKTYEEYREKTKNNLLLIKGEQTDSRLVVGDNIVVYGRYNKIETTKIDEVSYTIPNVNAYRILLNEGYGEPEKYDSNFIKKVAKILFGDEIEVRNATDGEDYDSSVGMLNCTFEDNPFMICEPENQSNSKFTKYRMFKNHGLVEDAKSKSFVCKTATDVDESNIIRFISFSADFEHYLIYTLDEELSALSVGYYDKDFKKLWQRDFEETINAVYDYTATTLYIVANNDLYTIDITTGEDVIKPSYVGQKTDIRKVADGLIMFNDTKADSVMKVDSNGDIVWKTNISNELYLLKNSVQFVNDKIIISNDRIAFEISAKTGEIITTGEAIIPEG